MLLYHSVNYFVNKKKSLTGKKGKNPVREIKDKKMNNHIII